MNPENTQPPSDNQEPVGVVLRHGVTLPLFPAVTGKGKGGGGKTFLNLMTDNVSLEDIIKFITPEAALTTLTGDLRRFCLTVSDKCRNAQTNYIDAQKVIEVLTNMAMVRVTKGQLEDELVKLAGVLADYDPDADFTAEQALVFAQARQRVKAIRAQLKEMEEARKSDSDE